MKNKILSVFFGILLAVMPGCSFFASSTQSIHIDGTPADATVSVNGKVVKVPASLQVRRNENLTIVVHKAGYETYRTTTGYSLSTIGAVDAIGCWLLLLPGVGLLAPGAWELMENNFYYVLNPENAALKKAE